MAQSVAKREREINSLPLVSSPGAHQRCWAPFCSSGQSSASRRLPPSSSAIFSPSHRLSLMSLGHAFLLHGCFSGFRRARTGVRQPEHPEMTGSSSIDCGIEPFAIGEARGSRKQNGCDPPSPATFDGGSWFHDVQLNLLVVWVPLVRDESG